MEFKQITKLIEVDGKEVEVTTPIPTSVKTAMIRNVVETDFSGTASKLSYDVRILTHIALFYTNIAEVFEDELKDKDILETYDILDSNGIMELIISVINKNSPGELDRLIEYADDARKEHQQLMQSPAMGILNIFDNIANGLSGITEKLVDEDVVKALEEIQNKAKEEE